MAGTQTFTMIKPDAVSKDNIGNILKIINEAGFRIKAMKFTQLTKQQAARFYAIHADKDFFEELITFMSCGPVVAAILEKENAVSVFRELIGSTDPVNASEGTIRKLFAHSRSFNAIHGSDSDTNAIIESDFFFSKTERYEYITEDEWLNG